MKSKELFQPRWSDLMEFRPISRTRCGSERGGLLLNYGSKIKYALLNVSYHYNLSYNFFLNKKYTGMPNKTITSPGRVLPVLSIKSTTAIVSADIM